ncbi:MAG TPA: hypothetical protein VFO54_03465 [Chryseosolibacter sp.]|nr:hypothetical protein [Chryseosolibacter sp.]
MKPSLLRTLQTILSAGALTVVFLLSGCGGSDPEPAPTQAEKVIQMLTSNGGKWTPLTSAGVLVDGVDVTQDLFSGFTITFLENTYTTTGTSPVWLAQDTWQFKDESATIIIRGQDNREITIELISDTQLKLTLDWPTTTNGGRSHSLKGKHEFFLNK